MSYNGYVQIPPDSTGKKVGHIIIVELEYQTGTIDFDEADVVIGATSGATGEIVKIVGNTISGTLFVRLSTDSPLAFIVGENLTVDSVTYALAASVGERVYNPTVTLVDFENPFLGANISDEGALITTTAEGSFGFDAFGNLKISQEQILGLYQFNYGASREDLEVTGSNGGQLLTSSYHSGIVFSNPTTSDAHSRIRSHLYHPYQAGVGQKFLCSIVTGDAGKDGVIRRWGYYDDNDGMFFELSGSVMNVVVRNSSTGTIVERRIPQSQWNSDRANGQGGDRNISRADLDVSKGTVYFIDFQWLGVGRIRFGMIWSGKRVVVHTFNHNAELDRPYISTATLPITIEQMNIGVSPSTSEMRSFAASVVAATPSEHPFYTTRRSQTVELTTTLDWTGSFRPLFSVRARSEYLGKDNRTIALPSSLKFLNCSAPVILQIHKWPILTGDTWTVPTSPYGAIEGDTTATTASMGFPVLSALIPPQSLYEKEFDIGDWNEAFKIHRLANIESERCAWTVMGKLANTAAAPSSSLTIMMDWAELL